jgi:hypothetical protein
LHFGRQQPFPNKAVDFRAGQFDHQAAQPLPPSFPVVTHTFGGSGAPGCGTALH